MIRGLIFDFDGLIVDTESTVYQSWQELYREYGEDLPFEEWGQIIGTSQNEHFNPFDHLEARLGYNFDEPDVIKKRRHQREMKLVARQPVLPGVLDYLDKAKQLGLRLAIASSSSFEWVGGHLEKKGLIQYFDVIHTSDDVERTKPDPALYQLALESLALKASEVIVLEDSPNGVTAAQKAGIVCVAVPNPLTRLLALDHADLLFDSLADVHLQTLIQKVEAIQRNNH